MLVKAKQLLIQVTKVSSGMVIKFLLGDKPFYRRFWLWAGLGVGSGIAALNYGIGIIDESLPGRDELQAIAREQTLTIKAADGTILQQQGEATREQLKLNQIPDRLKKAFIASEDRRFGQHNGVDYQGIFRAVVSNLRSQEVVEGGSTITQQVARILFLKQERTIWRKLKEIRLAQKIEQELTKQQILERYLNLVYLGSGAYGVADAAWVYFSKPVDKLTLSEMATIAGLAPAPNIYAPDKNPQAALARRNLVLHRMEEDGVITAYEAGVATKEPLVVKSSLPKRLQIEFPYFTSYVQKELPKYVAGDVLAGGLVVETTLNPTWQKYAQESVTKILKNQGRWENFQEAALVAINPRNGEIQAMVGGKDFGKNQFNRVTQAKRQPGSTFKGFVYATAIASGKNPYDTYVDEPLVIDGYSPQNSSRKFSGTVTMKEALTRSINIVAVKVLLDVGFQPTIQLAHDMGIKSELKPTYSLALGSSEVNLLELTSAYGTFATEGLHTEVHGIRRIINRQGQVIWSAKYSAKRVLDADSTSIMTWMLRGVVESGTGTSAQLEDRPVAGKTGTTDEARDLWFIGYIPQLVAGVWLGNDDNHPTNGTSVSAAYAWHEFMTKVVKGMPIEKFPPRPKLEGRKGTIHRNPAKPKKIAHESVDEQTSEQDKSSDTDVSTRSKYRHRRREETRSTQIDESQSDDRPRHKHRRHHREQTEDTTTPKRHHREQTEDTAPISQSQQREEETPRRLHRHSEVSAHRRHHRTGEDGSPPSSSKSNNSSGSATSQPSWRERLKPNSSPPE